MHTRKRLLSMLLLRIYHWKYAIVLLTMTVYALPFTSAASANTGIRLGVPYPMGLEWACTAFVLQQHQACGPSLVLLQ